MQGTKITNTSHAIFLCCVANAWFQISQMLQKVGSIGSKAIKTCHQAKVIVSPSDPYAIMKDRLKTRLRKFPCLPH